MSECARCLELHQAGTEMAEMYEALKAENIQLREALEDIAEPLDCGCKPCIGACRSLLALEIELDARRDIARSALSAEKSKLK
jgi:hypothetical protein